MNWRQTAQHTKIVVGLGALSVGVAGGWFALPQASAAPQAQATTQPAIARSVCDSDAATRALHQVKLRDRGDKPGSRAIFSIESAKAGSKWSYEVSLTVGKSERVSTGNVVIQSDGTASFSIINKADGRAYAESGVAPLSGKQYCSIGLTASV